jgi:hypothetical protein
MGVAPFNIASSVILITAQRLARRLCSCKQRSTSRIEALISAGFDEAELDGSWQPYGPKGCERCKGSGYKGRLGIYQVMPISEEIARIIMTNGNSMDIAQAQRRRPGSAPVRPAEGEARGHLADRSPRLHQRVIASRGNNRWPLHHQKNPCPQRRRRREHLFVWEGKDKTGKIIRGEMRATTETVVQTVLRRQGILAHKIRKQAFARGARSPTRTSRCSPASSPP